MSSAPHDDARRALDAARLLARGGFPADAVSRAYYAAFYAARDAVQAAGAEPRTHSGVASEFSRLYVRTGRVSGDAARHLRRLASKRADADYEGIDLSAEDAASAIEAAETFVEAVEVALGLPAPASQTDGLSDGQKADLIAQLTREMDAAAANLEFEKAAELRDSIAQIEAELAA